MRAKTTLARSRQIPPSSPAACLPLSGCSGCSGRSGSSGSPGHKTCEPDPWFWVPGGRSAFYRGMEVERGVVGRRGFFSLPHVPPPEVSEH